MPLCLGSRGNFVYLVLNVVSRGKIGESFFFSPGRQTTDSGTIFFVCFTGQEKRCAGHIHRLLIPFRLFCTSASHTIFFSLFFYCEGVQDDGGLLCACVESMHVDLPYL